MFVFIWIFKTTFCRMRREWRVTLREWCEDALNFTSHEDVLLWKHFPHRKRQWRWTMSRSADLNALCPRWKCKPHFSQNSSPLIQTGTNVNISASYLPMFPSISFLTPLVSRDFQTFEKSTLSFAFPSIGPAEILRVVSVCRGRSESVEFTDLKEKLYICDFNCLFITYPSITYPPRRHDCFSLGFSSWRYLYRIKCENMISHNDFQDYSSWHISLLRSDAVCERNFRGI